MTSTSVLMLGAVAYDPKVVTIWTGFREWFAQHDFPFDYVLYSHYERQVEALVNGEIHVAWNSPLAWVRANRVARARGASVEAVVMRDTDRDLTSVIVVRGDSPIQSLADLRGHTLAVGAVDSPQATLLPLAYLKQQGIDVTARRFDIGVGLHGDHIGGERDAARALVAGEVDAACMIDSNHLRFSTEGTLPPGSTRVIGQTPAFDHCNMTVGPAAPADLVGPFTDLLMGMSYADPVLRPLLDLEGLKAWCPGRLDGYQPLERAVDILGFYDSHGEILATDYRP